MANTAEMVRDRSKLAGARDSRSDEMKAAAILGVVCIHASIPYVEVLRFCVPMFIALWAFHYERGLMRRSGFRPYAAGRFYRLAIPYAFWTTIYLLLLHPLAEWTTTPIHTILGGWLGGYGWAGQYFFIILFQLTWLLPLMRHRVTPVTTWAVVVFGFFLNTATSYFFFRNPVVGAIGDRLFIYWLPYVFLGIAFAHGFPLARRWFLLGALALLAAPMEMTHLVLANGRASPYLLSSVTAGSIALLLAIGPRWQAEHYCQAPRSPRFAECIRYIGRNSLPIFVCNPLFLLAAQQATFLPDQALWGLLSKGGVVIGAVAGSLLVGWALRRLGLGVLVGA